VSRLARHPAAWLVPLVLIGVAVLAVGLGAQPGEAQDRTPRAWVPFIARDEPAAVSPTPTGTPTPVSFVFRRLGLYIDEGEGFRNLVLVGEVVNNRAQAVQFVDIKATYAIGDAPPFAEASGFPYMDVIPAGGVAPFVVVLEDAPMNLTGLRIELDIPSDGYISPPEPGRAPPVGLVGEILLDEVFVDPETGLEVLFFYGTITNNSNQTYAAVFPVVALYSIDAEGALSVVRVGFDVLVPEALGPGETGEFILGFQRAQAFDWDEARLFIDAVRQ
jgi:hypothetical protein